MNFRKLLIFIAVCLPALTRTVQAEEANKRPNVIVILADDLGYGDLACHGNTHVATPRLDALAKQSVELRQFHVAPSCAPTRAAFLTGRHFLETGVWGVHQGRDYVRLDELLLPQVFQNAGYATAMFGKWHSGKPPAWQPHRRGFDEGWMANLYTQQDNLMSRNGEPVQLKGWTTERLTDMAIDFMQRKKSGPFFLYVPYLAVHAPWDAPENMVARYRAKGLSPSLATLDAMIEQLDTNIGRILDELDRLNLADNTIVVFFSDNGPIAQSADPSRLPHLTAEEFASRNPTDMRGSKGTIWENGTRVPLFVRWSGRFRPAAVNQTGHVTDLFPTLIDLAGIPTPPAKLPRDGQSLRPLLEGRLGDWNERIVFSPAVNPVWDGASGKDDVPDDKHKFRYEDQMLAAYDGSFKLVRNGGTQNLFDLSADPTESHDVSGKYPEKTASLEQALHAWYQPILESERSYGMPRFRIGESGETESTVFACACQRVCGYVHGGEHYTTDWRAAGDSETLLVDILQAGRYRVKLDGKAVRQGAVLEMTVGKVLATVNVQEGFHQDFGVLELPAGPAELILTLKDVGSESTAKVTTEDTPAPKKKKKSKSGAQDDKNLPPTVLERVTDITFTRL